MASSSEVELKAGWDLCRRGDFEGAEHCCRKVLSLMPSHGGALGLLGVLRLSVGRLEEAISLLVEALQGRPRDAMLQGWLGLAQLMHGDGVAAEAALRSALKWGDRDQALLRMRLGMALGMQGRQTEAIEELRRAQALAPEAADILLNLANAVAEAGQVAEAESLLRRVLQREPDHGDARFNLATLYAREGRLKEAEIEFGALLGYYPGYADVHNSLGVVLERQGRLDAAEEAYRQVLALDGKHISGLNNLGNVLRACGQLAEAEGYYTKAIGQAPGHADGYLNLGMLLAEQERLNEACILFRKALDVDSRCLEAAINLGEVLRRSEAFPESAVAFRSALQMDARNALALNGLGNVLRMQGEAAEAAGYYLQATRAAPLDVNGFLNLGILRAQQGHYDEACALLRQAVKIDPTSRTAQLKLAEVLRISGYLEESGTVYRQLLSLQPGHAAALAGLAHVRQHLCDWDGIEALWEQSRRAISDGEDAGITPFSALSIPTTPQEQLACARAWSQREFGWIKALRRSPSVTPAAGPRPLTLGYLSWDYHEHATAYLMAEVFELHDRERFKVHAYSFGPDDGSAIRQRIRGASDTFVDVAGLSDAAVAQRIAADGVDILIDLKGYTLGARTAILAYRPAPVQVNWLGFPGTMGADCIDWILGDGFIIPEGAEAYYQERVCRLPDCYQPNDRKREVGPVPGRFECGLPETGIVFCCFNQAYKILPETFAAWMRILQQVPGSVLWLLETTDLTMANLKRNAAAHGIAAERIVFAPRRPLAAHLARYRVADLAIDTFPYTSHTTASDALWAGCPLVTRVGDTFASRVAGSVLRAAGLAQLLTGTEAEFEALAVQLALDAQRRQALRDHLERGRAGFPLFDAPRFVLNLEAAYSTLALR